MDERHTAGAKGHTMLSRILLLALGLTLAVGATLVSAAEPEAEAANAAVAYIETLQNPDGGFPAFGEESAPQRLEFFFLLAWASFSYIVFWAKNRNEVARAGL